MGTKNPTLSPRFLFPSGKRRASVASALHGNAASILLDARLRDDERFPNAPRRALEHALLACDADVEAGADADAASVCIDVVADAFDALGNAHEAELHRARAEAVRAAKKKRRTPERQRDADECPF